MESFRISPDLKTAKMTFTFQFQFILKCILPNYFILHATIRRTSQYIVNDTNGFCNVVDFYSFWKVYLTSLTEDIREHHIEYFAEYR